MKKLLSIRGLPVLALVLAIIVFKLFASLAMVAAPPHEEAKAEIQQGAAIAQTPEVKAEEPVQSDDEKSAPAPGPSAQTDDPPKPATPEEAAMESRKIQREKEELELLRTEVDEKIVELEELQKTIETLMAELEGAYGKKEKHLIKILSGMKPKKAAPMVDKLDMDLVVKLFGKMKSDKVGQILLYLEPEKAARISENLATRQEE